MPASQASEDIGPSTTSSLRRGPRRSHAGPPGHWRRNSRGHCACVGAHSITSRAGGGDVWLNARANKANVSRGALRLSNGSTDQNRPSASRRRSGKREFLSTKNAGNIAASRPPSVTKTTRRARESSSAGRDACHQARNHAGRQVGLPHATERRSHSRSYRCSSSKLSITRHSTPTSCPTPGDVV